jgi:predicted Zn-dependent protease
MAGVSLMVASSCAAAPAYAFDANEVIGRIRQQVKIDTPVFIVSNSVQRYAAADKNGIYISAGLRSVLPSDDAWAFILAHEFAHIIMDHKIKPHTLAKEIEADAVGLDLAELAGYSKAHILAYTQTLATENKHFFNRYIALKEYAK